MDITAEMLAGYRTGALRDEARHLALSNQARGGIIMCETLMAELAKEPEAADVETPKPAQEDANADDGPAD